MPTSHSGLSGRVPTYLSEELLQSMSPIALDPQISLLSERLNNITINSCSYLDSAQFDYMAVYLPPFSKGEDD